MRHLVPLLFCLLGVLKAAGQNDSLWSVWNSRTTADSSRLKAIQVLAWKAVFEQPDSGMALARGQLELAERVHDAKARYEAYTTLAVGSSMKSDYTASLGHLQQCLAIAQEMGDRKRQANAFSNMSNVYKNLGDLPMALEQLQKSLRIDTEIGNKEGLAGNYNNIGNIYTELGDLPLALQNYQRSAGLAEELDNTRGRAQAMLNLGATHLELGELDTALIEFQRSLALYRTMGRKLELGMAFNNLGRVYGKLGRSPEAFASLDSAEHLLTSLGSMRQIARTFINRGNLHLDQKQYTDALNACSAGLALAETHGLLQQQRECQQCLLQAYEALGDYRRAFLAQRAYHNANDSLLAINNSKEVARMEVTRVFQERMLADSLANVRERYESDLAYQEQLGRERNSRNVFLFSGIGVLLMAAGLWLRLRFIHASRAAISKEKERSEDLLHNILPKEVAAELKLKGHAEAKHFDKATILFTDFKGFTQVSETLSPQELVEELNTCFKAFDHIITARGVEKIKTIGDAYMCAGGLPDPQTSSPSQVVLAALEMQAFMVDRKVERDREGKPAFEMRVGIHTGPVVAGIVGVKKFQYDIWGDTVNTASRMESSGVVGMVNISESTYSLVRDTIGLHFSHRGKVQAKGKGALDMYFAFRDPLVLIPHTHA